MPNCRNCLHNSHSFIHLTEDEINFLNQYKTQLTANKGENIIKQNTFISNIICVNSGIISLVIEGDRDRNICIGIAGKGDILGVTDLLSNGSHSFTAVSLKSSEICIYEAEKFKMILDNNMAFRDKMLEQYSIYIKHLHSKLMVLGTKQLHGRLADTILYLNHMKSKFVDVFNYISRKDLALMTGTSVENVIRLLKEFDHDGIIKISGKEIIINNLDLLLKLKKIG